MNTLENRVLTADVLVKRPTTARSETPHTYMGIVLDKSGSMHGLQADIVGGVNAEIAVIRRLAKLGGQTYVSFLQFDSFVTPIYWNRRPETLVKLDAASYTPSGGTALYDALARMLTFMETVPNADAPNTAFRVKVFTDGEENESKEVNGYQLARQIRRLTETGRWTIDFVGANIDLDKMSANLGITRSNMYRWTPTHIGTQVMSAASAGSTESYLQTRSMGGTASQNLYEDFKVDNNTNSN